MLVDVVCCCCRGKGLVTGWVLFLAQMVAVVEAGDVSTEEGKAAVVAAVKKLVFPIRHMCGLKVTTYLLFLDDEQLSVQSLGIVGRCALYSVTL